MTTTPFENLYIQYKGAIHSHIYRMVKSREWAEDLTQETFLKAWRAWERLSHCGNLSGWLYQIATRTTIDAVRSAQVHPNCCYSLHEERIDDMQADPLEVAVRRDEARRRLADLREEERRVLLREACGYTQADRMEVYRVRHNTRARIVRHEQAQEAQTPRQLTLFAESEATR